MRTIFVAQDGPTADGEIDLSPVHRQAIRCLVVKVDEGFEVQRRLVDDFDTGDSALVDVFGELLGQILEGSNGSHGVGGIGRKLLFAD